VTWSAPTATDNIAVTSFDSTHNSGDAFPVGSTTVTYTASDAAGNSADSSFAVTVTFTEPPPVDTITDYAALNILSNGSQDFACTTRVTLSGGQAVSLIDSDAATCTADKLKEDKLKQTVASTAETDLITFYLNNGYLVDTQVTGQATNNDINFKSKTTSGTLYVKLVEVNPADGSVIAVLDTQNETVTANKRLKVSDISSLQGIVSAGNSFGIQLTWEADSASKDRLEIKWGKYNEAGKQTLINVAEGPVQESSSNSASSNSGNNGNSGNSGNNGNSKK